MNVETKNIWRVEGKTRNSRPKIYSLTSHMIPISSEYDNLRQMSCRW